MKTSHSRTRRPIASAIVVVLSVLATMLLGAVASPASAATGMTPALQTVSGTVGVSFTPTSAFSFATSTAPVAFLVSPALPAGLTLDPGTGIVSGTPTLATPAADYTVSATDASADAAVSAVINITVVDPPPPTPTLVPATQPAIVGTIGMAIASSQSVAPTNFVNPPILTVSPALPAYLTFDSVTGVISGVTAPTAALAPTDFTITATDGAVTATSVVNISVTTPTVTPSAAALTAPVGGAFSPVLSFTPVGFPATPTYALAATPALPPGVTFSAAGALVGSPTSAWPTKTYTVTATSGSATAQTTFSLTVSTGTLAPASQSIVTTVGTAASTPAYSPADLLAAGLLAPVTFSITPALPTGLLFSTSTGAITGKPTVGTPLTTHTVTATDTNGATSTATINVTVTETQLDPPVIYAASAGTTSGSLRVLFTGPLNAPVGQIYSLEVYDASGASLIKTVKPFTSLTEVAGLTAGSTYSVIVVAEASAGYLSSKSVPRNGIASSAAGRLTAPVITTISGGTAVGSITVAFTPSANAPAGQTYSAQVYDEDQITLIKSVKGTSPITITGLTPGVTYYVVVVADASAAFLESPSRGRTAVATASKAIATPATSQNTATATGLTPSAGNVTTARSLGAGWYLVTAQQAAKAKRVVVKKSQALSIRPKLAPTVNVRAGKVISLRIRGLAANAQIVADVKLLKKWTSLGSARTNAKGMLIVPAFQATVAGRYVIRLTSITGVPTYLAVNVKAKP